MALATRGIGAARAAGERAGKAQGLAEGRALQVPPSGGRRMAFRAGYAAGANDVFGGYDGGWYLGRPYVITLARGRGPIAYRIDSRTPLSVSTTRTTSSRR